MWYIILRAYNSNHSRYSNSMFIRTIIFHNTITTLLGLAKFLTIQKRWRFESISTCREIIPNTNLGRLDQWSPLVQLRSTFHGFNQCRTIRDDQLPGCSGTAYPWAHVWLPANPYYHLECALLQNGVSLIWATRLHGRNELFSKLSERHAFKMTEDQQQYGP